MLLDANRVVKAAKCSAIIWIVSLILFKIAPLANLGMDGSQPIYAIASTLGLLLAI
jgi:hypothetical protein